MNSIDKNIFGQIISDPVRGENGDQVEYVTFRVKRGGKGTGEGSATQLVVALGQSAIYFDSHFNKGDEYGVDESLEPLSAKVYTDNHPSLEEALQHCVIVIDEPQSN